MGVVLAALRVRNAGDATRVRPGHLGVDVLLTASCVLPHVLLRCYELCCAFRPWVGLASCWLRCTFCPWRSAASHWIRPTSVYMSSESYWLRSAFCPPRSTASYWMWRTCFVCFCALQIFWRHVALAASGSHRHCAVLSLREQEPSACASRATRNAFAGHRDPARDASCVQRPSQSKKQIILITMGSYHFGCEGL